MLKQNLHFNLIINGFNYSKRDQNWKPKLEQNSIQVKSESLYAKIDKVIVLCQALSTILRALITYYSM